MQKFKLGFKNWGFSKIGLGFLVFVKFFSKSLIGLSPIYCDCSCVGPMWQFEHVLRHFSLCSCFFHHLCTLLHVRCLTECLCDIFVLNWIQVNSNFWVYTCLTLFNLFWSLIMCLTHFAHVAHTRHTLGPSRHTSCIMMHTHAPAHALPKHTHTYIVT